MACHLHQQQSHQFIAGENGQLGQLPPLPPPPQSGGLTGTARSLTDRARVAKVPLPESGLKCPRCESTNTKFCYYNNYSLTQPRHFCKTCRRYWTRGGALRNVPVGGGCRRNKRSKSRSVSKSPATTMAVSGNITTMGGGSGGGSMPPAPIAPPLSFMSASSNYGDMGGELGQTSVSNGFLLGDQQWRMQQLPYLSSFGAPPPSSSPSCGLFHFEGVESMNNGLNLSRHLVNLPGNYDHQSGWSHDVSGFMSSTTTHHL